MLNNIKIVFMDLDGTLLTDEKKLSIDNIEALKKLKNNNIKIALISGRIDAYILKYNEFINAEYIIANNGALIYDSEKKQLLFEDCYQKDDLKLFWNFSKREEIGITLNSHLKRYSNQYATTKEKYNNIINNLEEIDGNIYQIVFSSTNKEKITLLLNYLKNKNFRISYISKSYYENNDNVPISVDLNLSFTSKGNSANALLQKLNINKENSICFGDNLNDIDLFKVCKYSCAMKNSTKELLDIATFITLSNNDNGVAYFINNYLSS